MPEMDGLEVCRQIRKTPTCRSSSSRRATRRSTASSASRSAATTTSPSRSARASWWRGSTSSSSAPRAARQRPARPLAHGLRAARSGPAHGALRRGSRGADRDSSSPSSPRSSADPSMVFITRAAHGRRLWRRTSMCPTAPSTATCATSARSLPRPAATVPSRPCTASASNSGRTAVMAGARVKAKWRPSLAMVFFAVLLTVLALPTGDRHLVSGARRHCRASMGPVEIVALRRRAAADAGYRRRCSSRTITGPINALIARTEEIGRGGRAAIVAAGAPRHARDGDPDPEFSRSRGASRRPDRVCPFLRRPRLPRTEVAGDRHSRLGRAAARRQR